MKKLEVQSINEEEYKCDVTSIKLFEDEFPFSFAKIELGADSLKFAWNSKGINPNVLLIEEASLIFVGVDTYVAGFNYKNQLITFFLNTATNFKWFEKINNGMAIVAETGIILINIFNKCTLRNCFFFGDIIMSTKIEKDKMMINFLVDDDEMINI